MIHLTTQFNPSTGLWQFLVTHKDKTHWSRPMTSRDMERIAKLIYAERLDEGKGTANQFYLSHQNIISLINAGAFAPKKIPSTSKNINQQVDRKAQAKRWADAQLPSAVDILEELGL